MAFVEQYLPDGKKNPNADSSSFLNCPSCLKPFREARNTLEEKNDEERKGQGPWYLVCGHSICTQCFDSHCKPFRKLFREKGSEQSPKAVLACPVCDDETQFFGWREHSEGKETEDIEEKYEKEEKSDCKVVESSKVVPLENKAFPRFRAYLKSDSEKARTQKCSQCCEKVATMFCMDCQPSVNSSGAILCHECFNTLHPPMTKLAEHRAVPYDERPHEETCPVHPKKLLNIYCVDCEKLICKYCNDFGQCLGHDIAPLKNAASTRRSDVVELQHSVANHLSELHSSRKTITEEELQLEKNAEARINEVQEMFRVFHEKLEERKNDLIDAIRFQAQVKKNDLQSQRLQFVEAEAELCCSLEESYRGLRRDNFGFLDTFASIQSDLEKQTTNFFRIKSLKPMTSSSIPFRISAEDFLARLSGLGSIGSLATVGGGEMFPMKWDPSKCEELLSIQANDKSGRTLKHVGKKGEDIRQTCVCVKGFRVPGFGRVTWGFRISSFPIGGWISLGLCTGDSINGPDFVQDSILFCNQKHSTDSNIENNALIQNHIFRGLGIRSSETVTICLDCRSGSIEYFVGNKCIKSGSSFYVAL
eukprot:g3055.t1